MLRSLLVFSSNKTESFKSNYSNVGVMGGRSVIWITLESIRQDRTTIGGYERDTTPNLEAIASDGVAFDDCYSHDIWTRSSTASILTGYAPSAHRAWSTGAKLPTEIQTIPEAFQHAGYQTACISPNANISASTGLDRGFDDFHYLSKSAITDEVGYSSLVKWVLNYRTHTGGFTLDGNQ